MRRPNPTPTVRQDPTTGKFLEGSKAGGRPPRMTERKYVQAFRRKMSAYQFGLATERVFKIALESEDEKVAVQAWKALAQFAMPAKYLEQTAPVAQAMVVIQVTPEAEVRLKEELRRYHNSEREE